MEDVDERTGDGDPSLERGVNAKGEDGCSHGPGPSVLGPLISSLTLLALSVLGLGKGLTTAGIPVPCPGLA